MSLIDPKKEATVNNGHTEIGSTTQCDLSTGNMDSGYTDDLGVSTEDMKIEGINHGEGPRIMDTTGNIFLLPRPSHSPNDPLNWSKGRKLIVLALICWWYALAVSNAQFLSFIIPAVEAEFPNRPFSDINLVYTISAPLVAPGDILFAFSAMKWGMRPTVLFSLVVFVASSLIGAIHPGVFEQFLACRILSGIGAAPSDALCFIIIESFTFIHERGMYMAIVAFLGGGLNSLLCVCLTWITNRSDIRWAYTFYTIGLVIPLVGLWFFFPETNFKRDESDLVDPITNPQFTEFRKSLPQSDRPFIMLNPFEGNRFIPKRNYKETARWMFLAAIHPATWWLGVFQIVLFGGLSAVGTYFAVLLESPPWNWAAPSVSYMNFVVVPISILGMSVGILSDFLVLKLAKRRGGITKLEDRLSITPIPTMFGIAGFAGFGAMAQAFYAGNPPHWFACVFTYFLSLGAFFYSIQLSSLYMAGSTSLEHALSKFSVLSAIRDLGSFGLSYGIVPFTAQVGYLNSFGTYSALLGLLSLGAIPLYMHGERIRRWAAKNQWTPKSGVEQ